MMNFFCTNKRYRNGNNAPTYPPLSMGYFELSFYRICINEFGETLVQFIWKTGAGF